MPGEFVMTWTEVPFVDWSAPLPTGHPLPAILLNLQTVDLGCHFLLSFITMATAAAAAGCHWSLEGLPRETEVGDTKGNEGTEGVDE